MIISTFNYTWFLLIALSIAYIVLITRHFKDKTDEEKLRFMFIQSVVLCIIWVLYKVGLYYDKDYTIFEFWNELPLQPCNTVLWLSIISAKKNNKTIMAYSFFCGVLFATLALLMPSPGFYDINLLTVRGLGYYVTHMFVIIIGILGVSMKLVKLTPKMVLKAILCYLTICCIMHVINILLRCTVYPEASYYYTFGNKDNAVLTKIHDIFKIDLVYLVPLAAVGYCVFLLEAHLINRIGQLIHKRTDRN